MEIQDRNSLLQILVGAKEAKPQVSFDGNSFADVLESTKSQADVSSKDIKDVEFNGGVKNDVALNVKKNNKVLENNVKKETSQKSEDKVIDSNKNKENKAKEKEDVKEENAVATNQSVKEDKPVEEKNEVETNEVEEVVDAEANNAGEDVAASETLAQNVVAQGLDEKVLSSFLQTEVAVEDVVVSEGFDVVLNNVEEVIASEIQKQAETEVSKAPATEMVPMTEEEALLMEQAKYFDEKVASDKKLKIEVSVSEEKIAEPVVKDVLKNSFEINSMFQMVEDASEVKDVEAVLDETVQNVSEDAQTLQEVKSILYGEVKSVQETVKAAATKDMVVTSVSGKEVVSEVVNVSKNEAFAKINETIARDNYKGMSKEVIEQIKVNITKSAIKGVDTIDIQLKPEDLGKVQIKMYIGKDGKVQAEIVASRAETADMLQKDASSLSKAFNDAGYDTDAKSFTFSFQNENQTRGQEKDDAGLLKFIGDALEQEAENIAGNDNLGYDPVLGLNIRV